MRLRSLSLRAFGHFTGREISFTSTPGCVDIVLGANEAGKSTTLRGIESLCYGFDERTQDAHTHSYDQLLVGAEFGMLDGRTRTLFRKKGKKNTVLDRDGKPVADTLLEECMCGIAKSGFSALFCLDFRRLADASEALLEENGEVGKLLFEAGSNLNLKPVLTTLRTRHEELFKGTSRSSSLIDQSLRRYEEGLRPLKRGDVALFRAQEQVVQSLNEDEQKLKKLIEKRRADVRRLQRFHDARPLITQFSAANDALESLGPVVSLPDDFTTRRIAARRSLLLATQKETTCDQNISRIEGDLAQISVDEVVLGFKDAIEQLNEQVGQIEKSIADYPSEASKHEDRHEDAQAEIRRYWSKQVQAPDFGSVTEPERRNLKRLCSNGPNISSNLAADQQRREELESEIAELEKSLESQSTGLVTDELRGHVSYARSLGAVDDQIDDLEVRLRTCKESITSGASRLGLAEVESLPNMQIPSAATIRAHEAELSKAKEDLRVADGNLQRLSSEHLEATERKDRLLLGGDIPTETLLSEARSVRDNHWKAISAQVLHRTEPKSSDSLPVDTEAYENSIRDADGIADDLRAEADRVAQLASVEFEINLKSSNIETQESSVETARQGLVKAKSAWDKIWAETGVVALSPQEMLTFREEFDQICGLATDLVQLGAQVSILKDKRLSVINNLGTLIGVKVQNTTLAPLLTQCEEIISLEDAGRQAQMTMAARLEALRSDLKAHLVRLQQRESERDTWAKEFAKAVKDLSLPKETDAEDLDNAIQALEKAATFSIQALAAKKRADGMLRDIASFDERVASVAQGIAFEPQQEPFTNVSRQLLKLLQRESSASDRIESLRLDLTREKETLLEAKSEATAAESELQDLCRIAKCDDDQELDDIEWRFTEWKRLDTERQFVLNGLTPLAGGASIEEFCKEVQDADPDEVDTELDAAGTEISVKEIAHSTALSQIGEAQNELQRIESSGELLNARVTAEAELAKVRSAIRPYLIHSLAEALLLAQVEAFRQANQGPILKKAGHTFAKLTDSAYETLFSELDEKDKPVLVALRNDGKRIKVDGLSSATRMALYLSLRIACLDHHADTRECVPFIADDILLDFDDERAARAFQVLGELAQRTQVIFLTHHNHLAEIGARVLGDSANLVNL